MSITLAKVYSSILYKPNINREICELILATNAHYSYLYAANIINGRFKLGERVILKSSLCSHQYIKNIIKNKFKLSDRARFKTFNNKRYRKTFLGYRRSTYLEKSYEHLLR